MASNATNPLTCDLLLILSPALKPLVIPPHGMGHASNVPHCRPPLILSYALKRWGPPPPLILSPTVKRW